LAAVRYADRTGYPSAWCIDVSHPPHVLLFLIQSDDRSPSHPLLRAELLVRRPGIDAASSSRLRRIGRDRNRAHHLRGAGLEAAQRPAEKSRVPLAAGTASA